MTEQKEDESKAMAMEEDWREVTEKMAVAHEQYQYMQEHDILTDCTFVVGPKDGETREFKAHRLHIARVSAVFEAMLLRGEMVEAKTGHVRVTDLSPNTFQLLLDSIYGKEPEIKFFHEAQDLTFAAHKYQIKTLLKKAVTLMITQITPENIWTAFETADLLQEASLKRRCVLVLQYDTMRCIANPRILQASEENVALLLEQDELEVDDELLLVNAVVQWARHAARQRGLSGDDDGVRAVLEPRLLKLLRLVAMSHQQFMLGPGIAGWLTEDEKSAIEESLQSGDFSKLPQHLSSVAEKRKNVIFIASTVRKGKNTSVQFICKREIVGSGSNVQQKQKKCCPISNSDAYFNCIHATLKFKVNSSCSLLGVQCSSRSRADCKVDPTTFAAKKPVYVYRELIVAGIYNHTLSPDFQRRECSHMKFHQETEYNSTISLLFKKPVHLVPNNWFAIEVKFLVRYEAPGEYPNPKRSSRVCTAAGVEFEFRKEQHRVWRGFYSSENDGIIESLIFTL